LIPISIFSTTKILGHISLFCTLLSQTQLKRLKITKHIFYKYVLESNFAPIKGSGSFIFLKMFKIVSSYCSVMLGTAPSAFGGTTPSTGGKEQCCQVLPNFSGQPSEKIPPVTKMMEKAG